MTFVAIKIGRRQERGTGVSPVTLEAESEGRDARPTLGPIFIATLRAAAPPRRIFPRCSLLTYQCRYARRSSLEKQPTDQRRKPFFLRDRTLGLTLSLSPHEAFVSFATRSFLRGL
jgi:hypothetical protein